MKQPNAVGPLRQTRLRLEGAIFADLQGGFASAAKHLHVRVDPRNHVAGHVRRAVGQSHDVDRTQHSVPHVELAEFAHEGLSGVKAASDYVLERGSGGSFLFCSSELAKRQTFIKMNQFCLIVFKLGSELLSSQFPAVNKLSEAILCSM